ncbi:NUDIX hydrolase [Lysinibacillus halotolerans]|uniref:NUDIX domain-containing protein n=1 Tax=Lysinibacillus halotolerans TaxID=1368476 RepID=A0A3M8H458_9BACI|nr:NUDIX hydrolase [Lysinibacillus halotolerans]RNC97248.1 NUDIX domain-containing protein [Lysinibacillus halotolerans]
MKQIIKMLNQIKGITQTGLAYSKDPYDIERYKELEVIAKNLILQLTNLDIEKINLIFSAEEGYATPKTDIRCVVFNTNNQLLLVKEKSENRWALPGGWADIGLSPSEVAVKEAKEETGLKVNPSKVLAIMDKFKHNHAPEFSYIYKIFIKCEIIGGELCTGLETSEVGFFNLEQIKNLDLSTRRNTLEQIEMMFDYQNKPNKPIYFD